jgi:transcriptional regulator with XRE-family HTH domain
MDESGPDLVDQLRQAIIDSGLSQGEMARRSGVDQGQLSRFLRGERTMTLPAAAKLCSILGLELVKKAVQGTTTAPPAEEVKQEPAAPVDKPGAKPNRRKKKRIG